MNTNKKILFIDAEVLPIPSVKGGAVELLIDELLKENEKNKFADLYVISPYDQQAKQESKKYINTHFFFIKNSFFSYAYKFVDEFFKKFFKISTGIEYIHRACSIIKKHDFDLVVIENRPLFAKIIRKVYKGKVYLHLHNDYINRNNIYLNSIFPFLDKIIAVSEFISERVKETGFNNVCTVYNGIDDSLFKNNNLNFSYPKKILYSGRIVDEKGVLELVRAFNRIDDNNCHLDIIGDFDENAYKEKEFKCKFLNEIKSKKNIHYLGYIQNSKISKYYHNAYCGVVPSKVNEACSLSAIEMLMAGLPIIYTNVGSLPEVIGDKCGIMIDKENLEDNLYKTMVILLENEKQRNSKSVECQKKSLEYNMSKYISKMIEVIAQ